jgi:hypothetical protein
MLKRTLAAPVVLTALLVCAPAHADYYLKTKAMGGQMEMESWTSGKKQRTQSSPAPGSQNAMLGMAGQFIVITRVDKGVEWMCDPEKKIYQERPIALPYSKTEPENSGDADDPALKSMMAKSEETNCTPIVKELGGTRSFAGHEAKGYQGACEEGPQKDEFQMTMWMAPAKGELARMEKESNAFEEAKFKAEYANFPAAERREMEQGAKMIRDAFKMAFGGMKGAKVPKGVPLAMETPQGPEGMGGMFYEVTELRVGSVNPQVFELPPDYVKVEDVMKEKANDMMRQMGMDPEEMERMSKDMQAQGAAAVLAQAGNRSQTPSQDADAEQNEDQ